MNKLLHLSAILCICISAKSQVFTIDTSQITYENKLRPCYMVVYDAPAANVKKGWVTYMKKNHSIKIKGLSLFSNRDILTAEDVTISSISDKRMNLYTRITDLASGSELKFFVSFGYDFYIGPEKYPLAFEGMNKLLTQFSISYLNDFYAAETSGVLKEIKKLEKGISRDNRSIRKNDNKIRKASGAESSALESKNKALQNEIEMANEKIKQLSEKLNRIKTKQTELLKS